MSKETQRTEWTWFHDLWLYGGTGLLGSIGINLLTVREIRDLIGAFFLMGAGVWYALGRADRDEWKAECRQP